MKRIYTLFIALFLLATFSFAQEVVYLRTGTSGNYWNRNGNVQALNRAFGAGNWTRMNFEGLNVAQLLSGPTKFIFIDGSNTGTCEFINFINTYRGQLQTWVAGGGALFLNAAPNECYTTINLISGATLYRGGSGYGYPQLPSHSIFKGPFLPAYASQYRGNSFSHSYVSNGGTTLIRDYNGRAILSERAYGAGKILFGGLTLEFFEYNGYWSPNPNVHYLFANMLRYMYDQATACEAPVINCGADITINTNNSLNCGTNVTVPVPQVISDCNYTLSNSVNGTANASGFYPVGTTTIVWTATNESGNESTCSQTVTVNDNTLPVIQTKDFQLNLDANGDAVLSTSDVLVSATDNCGVASTSVSPTSFSCGEIGNQQVTVTVVDVNGNTATATATVTVTGTDTDGDGVPDACDLDNDNDGILDINECTSSNFFWSNPPTVSGYTASGTINGIPYTYTSSVPVTTTTYMFNHAAFPASYNVPNDNPTIQNVYASSNTLTFSSPMTNPVLVFASIGQPNLPVTIDFSDEIQVLWSTAVVQNSTTQITGNEGFAIIRLNGTYNSVSFDYLNDENWVNFAFGADFFDYCDTDNDGIADYLDLDSDGDGCYDAIEGSLGFSPDQAPNGRLTGSVDQNGVPVLASAQGQGVGTSSDFSANCFCELGIDETNPIALAKDITVYLDANGQASITPQDVDNGSSDNCGTVDIALDDMTFDCSDMGARNIATIVSDNTWSQSTVELVTPSQYVSVVNQLPDVSTYTLSASNAWPYGTVNFFSPAIPDALPIYANGGTKFYRNEFNLTGRPQSLRIRARVDNIMEIFVNGVSIGMEDDIDVANFSHTAYHDVYIDDNGVQNGYMGGMQFDAVTSQSILDLLHEGANELIFAIANTNGTDQGGFMVRMDAVADGVPVELTATDPNGNSSTATAFVVVKDELAPVITTTPISVTLTANGTVSITAEDVASAIDNCELASLELDQYIFDANDALSSPVTVLVTATDASGNISTQPVAVTVIDPVPVALCKDITVQLDENGNATILATDIDNGSSSVVGIGSMSVSPSSFDCSNLGANTVTLTVTSTLGSSATCTATVTVEDNIAPELTVPANMVVNTDPGLCGATVSFTATASDNCSANISYSVDPGSFFGKGLTTVLVTAADASGNSTSNSFTIEVIDNELPVITCPFDITVSTDPGVCGAVVNYSLPTATDNCGTGDLPTSIAEHTYMGTFNGHTYFLSNGQYTPEVAHARAIAAGGHLATISNAAENAFISAMHPDRIWIGMTDRDQEGVWKWINSEPVTYTNWSNGEPNNYGGNEDWAVINWAGSTWNDWYYTQPAYYVIEFDGGTLPTQLVSGLESGSVFPVGTTEVTYSVTDDSGNTVECSFNVTVNDNEAPTAISQDITVQLNDQGFASIAPEDIDAGSFDACGIETISVNITSFDCSNVGPNTVVLTATDVNGNSSTATATVTVEDNVAPNVIAKDVTVYLDENGQATITPADVDNGSSDACGIASLSLSQSEFDCASAIPDVSAVAVGSTVVRGFAGRTVTFSNININGTGNNTLNVLPGETVTISTNWASQYTSNYCPGCVQQFYFGIKNIGIKCLYSGNTSWNRSGSGALTITAPTEPGLYVIQAGSSLQYSCTMGSGSLSSSLNGALGYIIVGSPVTLTATDVNGNSATASFNVTVIDNTAPEVITQDITVQLDNNGMASIVAMDVNGGSFDNCEIASYSIDKNTFDCSNVGENTVTLTVTDVNGNLASATATVTVEDNVAPVVLTQDITVQLDASGAATISVADIDAGSSDACGIDILSLDITAFSCADVGTNTVTLTAVDINGNSASAIATVTVEDNVSPVVLTQDITVQLDDSGNASIIPEMIDAGSSDACGIASLSLDVSAFDCSNVGENTVTLTAVDVNGNSASATAVVLVEDNVAPVVLTQNIIINLDDTGNGQTSATLVDNGSSDACGIASMVLSQTDFDCSHVGDNTVTLTVTDVNGNVASAEATVTVYDITPPVVVTQDVTVYLDAAGNASITTGDIDAGSTDACGIASYELDVYDFNCDDVYEENTVTLTVTDVNGNVASASALVTVVNDLPEINEITVTDVTNIADAVSIQASYTDVNLASVSFDWGNGEITSGTVDTGAGMVYGEYVYAETGLYDVTVTITDVCGETATETYSYVVIYDPCAGHVTGGGYFQPDKKKNNFGYNAKYDKETGYPKGNVNFHNKDLGLHVKADTAFWLMVNTDQAIFHGPARVNDVEGFFYIVSMIDGDVVQKHDEDFFRIIVWDEFDNIVYDNQPGEEDRARATELIDFGSLVIHKGCNSEEVAEETSTEEDTTTATTNNGKGKGKGKSNAYGNTTVTLYPNPVDRKLNLNFTNIEDQQLYYDIVDFTGRAFVKNVNTEIEGSVIELDVTDLNLKQGNYMIILRNEDNSFNSSKNFLKK